jgi:hypothetical protein
MRLWDSCYPENTFVDSGLDLGLGLHLPRGIRSDQKGTISIDLSK